MTLLTQNMRLIWVRIVILKSWYERNPLNSLWILNNVFYCLVNNFISENSNRALVFFFGVFVCSVKNNSFWLFKAVWWFVLISNIEQNINFVRFWFFRFLFFRELWLSSFFFAIAVLVFIDLWKLRNYKYISIIVY